LPAFILSSTLKGGVLLYCIYYHTKSNKSLQQKPATKACNKSLQQKQAKKTSKKPTKKTSNYGNN